ncbi:MAG: N-acetylglucosamine-6-phosphate deacetylase [Planctomycetaceae bacterium]|nr:MAG: N-acetylglucosamine-6-phosphate deacetylase [Planctomycetaceae bacterium]
MHPPGVPTDPPSSDFAPAYRHGGRAAAVIAGLVTVLLGPIVCSAQTTTPATTRPAEGILQTPPTLRALVGGNVVVTAGEVIESATVLIDGDTIVTVGARIDLPPGTEIIDAKGKSIYPALVDAAGGTAGNASRATSDGGSAAGATRHWNRYVTPENSPVVPIAGGDGGPFAGAADLRQQGIAVRLLAPPDGIFGGWGHAVLVGGPPERSPLLRGQVAQSLRLTIPPGGGGGDFPRSPMGAVALVRQTLLDADWYDQALRSHRADSRTPAPESDGALQTLAEAIRSGRFIVDCPNERFIGRADAVGREFALSLILRGSGREYRLLDSAVAAGRPLLIPVNFPAVPDVETIADADDVSLTELMHWYLAPENPSRLAAAGVRFALTTDGLEKPSQFLDGVRMAVRRGLDRDVALAAVTTIPAQLLGVDDRVGSVSSGKLANLIVTDGDLMRHGTEVLETWVAGRRYRWKPEADLPPPTGMVAGEWKVALEPAPANTPPVVMTLKLDGKTVASPGKWSGELRAKTPPTDAPDPAATDATEQADSDQADSGQAKSDQPETQPKKPAAGKLSDLLVQRDRLTASFDAETLGPGFPPGLARLSVLLLPPAATAAGADDSPVDPATGWLGEVLWADGVRSELRFATVAADAAATTESTASATKPEADAEPAADADAKKPAAASESADSKAPVVVKIDCPINRPLGAAGLPEPPATPAAVLFRNATVWTCAADGILVGADVLVIDGKISAVGPGLTAPEDCLVVDASGKHLTPGIIDCHSHIATDGGVNEASRAVTADCRIGDFIDHTDISIYRQLAGGVTTANILHGSANPIGGQNQVIKLRWGSDPDGLRFKEAPAGIKFALGENVKRDTWREGSGQRYPQSRMGVEQLLRDRFLAAREYDAAQRAWQSGRRSGLPPRRDLRLEALAEVLRGQRWVHCHSYRQDEIAALLEVMTEFNVQIGTLQHILEGYKVAEALAEHQAMASTFADWWAYKFEVYDAIPFNAAVMAQRGIVVSMNSDDQELGRHLNIEAAKAVRYGGAGEQEAFKMVTLNPARQLRIDDRVGSIEPGKDADLVLWSGRPLSTLSRCEQTWIDGRPYFSRDHAAELSREQAELRTRLIRAALDVKKNRPATKTTPKAAGDDASPGEAQPPQDRIAEEDRWPRVDLYCAARRGHLPLPPPPAEELPTAAQPAAAQPAAAGAQP